MQNLSVAAESIENLCTVEMREPGYTFGVIRRLYESGREAQAGIPTEQAVRSLISNISPGDIVIIATGAYLPDYLPMGETDGPPGAASLAYALNLGLGAKPLILCEEQVIPPIEACCRAIGLGTNSLEVTRRIPYSVTIDSFPTDEQAEQRSTQILETLKPKALIAIERLGVNSKGVTHSATGLPTMNGRSRLEVLFSAARRSGIQTIGIGDNGNEIGFGLISDAVRKYKPYGKECQCPCKGGIACVDQTDVLIPAATSNWGGYGVAACLAIALRDPSLIHDSATEIRMIDACARAGAVDGATGMYTLSVDGIPGSIHGYFVEMLRCIVEKNLGGEREREF